MTIYKNKTEIFLFPTDTVPGIGCFLSSSCVEKLRELKKRPLDKPFPILLSGKREIKNWVEEIPPIYERLKRFFPGGITLIFKGKKNLPPGVLSKEGKVGIRIPKHKELRDFIRKNKLPLIATSANISGSTTPGNLKEVKFKADRIIKGEEGSGKPSTVLDISTGSMIIYRKGEISILEIEKATGEEVKLGKNLDFNILFVCRANECRSPMAEVYLKHLTGDLGRVNIRSAGINAMTGLEIYEEAKKLLWESNLKAEHTSSLLTKPMIDWADLIFVMEDIQKEYITFLSSRSKNKIAFLRNFNSREKKHIIEDPVGKDSGFCRETFEVIKEANKKLEKYIRNKFS
jgi:L-threonylcarbamoyladenylate synthase